RARQLHQRLGPGARVTMNARDVIEELPIAAWQGPFDPALRARAIDSLEAGRVLPLPCLPFHKPPAPAFRPSPQHIAREPKNISLELASGALGNAWLGGAEREQLAAMLRRFGESAERLLHDLLPGYAAALERARTSFRPAEIAGRAYSPRHDDRLLHVDA